MYYDFTSLAFSGVLAAALSVFAFLPYIADTLSGRTRPQRATWAVWAVLASISTAAQAAAGADHSLAFSGMQAAMTALIAVMALRAGFGRGLSRGEFWVLVVAGTGVGLWLATDSPAFALTTAIGVSAIGGLPTIAKAYRAPQTETLISWVLGSFASVLAIYSVGSFDPLLMAYPVYLCLLYTSIVFAMLLGRFRGAVARV